MLANQLDIAIVDKDQKTVVVTATLKRTSSRTRI